MGIRIHKKLGYGLIDVACKDGRIADPRFNQDSLFISGERLYDAKAEDYVAWVQEKKERVDDVEYMNLDSWALHDPVHPRGRPQMYDTFAYDAEYGLANVVLLTPLMCPDWHRYDDDIDYVEETYLRDGTGQRVEVLQHGIYPWNGIYFDRRTGERLRGDRDALWRRRYFSYDISDDDREKIARVLGFDTFAEADASLGPIIPHEVRDLAEYGELFVDPDTWRQLQPLLYVWWS